MSSSSQQLEQQQSLPTTVAGTLRLGIRIYEDVLDSSALEPDFQKRIGRAVTMFLRLWSHIQNEGIFRRNESLREMTDTALELIPVPYYLGVLCEKRMLEKQQQDSRQASSSSQNNQGSNNEDGKDDISKRISRSNSRMQALVACNDFLFKFLKVAIEVGLATERDVATKPFIGSVDRNARLDMTKKRHALETEVKDLTSKVQFARERARRNARIMKADDEGTWAEKRKKHTGVEIADGDILSGNEKRSAQQDDDEMGECERAAEVSEEYIEGLLEDDDDYQSNKRLRHIRYAEWAILETYSVLQSNSREMEMLGSLTDAEKRKAVEDFQRELNTPAGGGFSSSASSAVFNQAARNSGVSSSSSTLKVDAQEANYTILPGGRVVPMGSVTNPNINARQEIREEAFMNRNMPTQTLAEFAEMEMEYMRMAQGAEKKAKDDKEAEAARLGEDGVEEQERQREAAWDDWKDANPSVGITSKGNYS